MRLSGQKIVITGATGFIGSHVTRLLLEQGAKVFALVRPESRNKDILPMHPQLAVVPCAMEHVNDCVRMIQSADAFLHFAWGGVNRDEIDSPAVQEANIASSLACVQAARLMGCRLFMDAGSRVEYGITKNGIMTETMDCHPVNEYGKAKLTFYQKAVLLCRQWGMTYYHLRFFSVYGIGDHPWSIISTLVRDLPAGQTVSLSACEHQWNFMEIEDAARAVLLLYLHSGSRAGQSHIVNVASQDTRKLRLFVEEIYRLCGSSGSLAFGTFEQAREGALSVCPTADALIQLTDGEYKDMISFAEGIRRMLSVEEENL
ncbi:MAG: NAD-dependent epimerase/dehydratase family protein [Lachnospiraceae bacterium]